MSLSVCLSACLLPAPHRCESAQVRELIHLPHLALEEGPLSLPWGLESNLTVVIKRATLLWGVERLSARP